jgi:hypothetical protein
VDPGLQRPDRLVVGVDGGVELATEGAELLVERDEAIEELAADARDGGGVLGL